MTAYDAAMRAALDEARAALASDDVPIGAVVLGPDGVVLGAGTTSASATATPPAMPSWSRSARPRPGSGSGG